METIPIEAINIQAENDRHRQMAIEHYKKNPIRLGPKYADEQIGKFQVESFKVAIEESERNKAKEALIEERKIGNAIRREAGPSLTTMAGNFIGAMGAYAKDGFRNVNKEEHAVRQAICNGCEFWDAKARMGAGKCMKCGCSGAKLWMASSECPIKKWGKIPAGVPAEPQQA
jgi:hypothetical protein